MNRRRLIGLAGVGAAAVAVAVGLASAAARRKPPVPERVVLVTIDTLRADHLEVYGYPRRTAPFIASLARDGVVWDKMFAVSSHTGPCHASLFTSLYPDQHGLLNNGQPLAFKQSAVTTLASEFAAAGYATGGFISVEFLSEVMSGFQEQGVPRSSFHDPRPANETVDAAIAWVESLPPRQKFFLWIHVYDVHNSAAWDEKYQPWIDAVQNDGQSAGEAAWVKHVVDNNGLPRFKVDRPTILREKLKSYDGRIRFVDEQLARLHAVVSSTSAPASLWIVTSDHGEGLGNHGHFGHGLWIYDEQVHIPLVAWFSDRRSAGLHVTGLTQQLDVMPGLCGMIGRPARPEWEGAARAPWAESTGVDEVFITRRPNTPREETITKRRYALRTNDWKYFWSPSDEGEELYKVSEDPLERKNLAMWNAFKAANLRDRLTAIYKRVNPAGEAAEQAPILPEHVEELKSLGYMQ